MGVYAMNVTGRKKPILLRAGNKTEAIAALVDGKSLTAEEVEEALDKGEKLWKPGTDLPEDEAKSDATGEGEE